ncbi:MFS monosaccharide transporter-like protein [Plenodomus tracheiphilus IPT5]|uniref:MFS monosaccharide transporter-like protein n=1 Tax=Plenodomus tracheiphilus IPT5 TaxID=1408161 RepID=A0A6A7ATI3_9PLEO|nr:MFS monosaccharide transporter-like protein [Plenodomus tracheiphilus IPT5]
MATPTPHGDFPTRGPVVLGVSAATLALCSLFVAFRLISRLAIVRKPGWDDHTMLVAWMLAFGASFAVCYGTTKGLGRRQENIPSEWQAPMKQSAYVFSVLYNPALMATKTSILLFYLTLSKTHKVFRWATITTLVVVNVGGLALTILNILQCRPIAAAWASPVPDTASCTNVVTIYLSSAPLNIITDMAILFLPMPILTSMRLPKKQKIILVITFGFGIFVAVVDVVRIAYLQNAQRDTLQAAEMQRSDTGNEQRNTGEFAWYASLSFMWSVVEINLGIMCGCVPALKPLVRRFLPSWVLDHTMRDATATHTSDEPVLQPDILDSRRRSDPLTPPASPHSKSPLRGSNGDDPVGLVDFLSTPDMNELPKLRPSRTAVTYATTAPTRRQSMTFFDFVDTGRQKNMTLRSNREALYPVLLVTILFFVWGFAYGFLDVLNSRFQQVAKMSDWETVGQHSAYYVGYVVGPLTFGRIVFKNWGFKACYMVGLSVYACGTLVFWPSAVLNSFPAFLVSNFITGAGLSTLELAANPFIALCGPPEYAEVRLNLSQGVQAIGTIVSPLLAKKVLFPANAESLIDVQWTYLGISFFNICLAIIYFYVPLPEATDEELDEASQRTVPAAREATVGTGSRSVKVMWISLAMAVFAQLCYVGGQESTSTSFSEYDSRVAPFIDPVAHQAYGHTAFAASRFLAAFMDIWIKPRYTLLFFFLGAIAFSAAAMHATGAAGAAVIVMVMFFEGPLFPQIFAQGIRGMGKHTKDASVLLTAAIGGGAVFPPIMFAALKIHNAQYAFVVIAAAYAAGTLYPIWLNTVPAAQALSDPVRDEQTRREMEAEAKRHGPTTTTTRKSKRWGKVKKRLGTPKENDQLPSVEHRERVSWPEGLAPRANSLAIEPVHTRTPSSVSRTSSSIR